MAGLEMSGRYPFGQPLQLVTQQERTPKRIFVLGVCASAVRARWLDVDGKLLVRALEVDCKNTQRLCGQRS